MTDDEADDKRRNSREGVREKMTRNKDDEIMNNEWMWWKELRSKGR